MNAPAVNRYTTWSQDPVVSSVDPKFAWLSSKFFGPVVQFDTETIEFDIIEGGRRIAPFVSPMALGRATRTNGMRSFAIRPAYIKLLDTVRPTQGFKRLPGEPYGGQLSPMQRLMMATAEKIAAHREMCETRWEAMAAEVLFNGTLTITTEDYPTALVDFERDPNLSITVGTVWSNTASTPFSDIVTVADAINKSSRGAVADTLTMRSGVFDNLMKNVQVRDSFDRNKNLSSNQNAGFETGPRSAEKGPILRGRLASQYDVWTYDGYYEADDGSPQFFVPQNKVLVNSEQSIEGRRYHGAILDMDAQMAAVEVFVKTRDLWNPSGIEVLTQSAPMLGMRRPNASGVLTVG